MNDQRIELLRDAPVKKAVNRMSLPAIIALLVVAIYNVVDTMFVAWLGTEATGATQVVFPIVMLFSAFGLMFGMGAGTYISRLLGAGDQKMADRVTSVSFFTSLGVALLFTISALIFMEPLLSFFGAEGGVMREAKDYGFYILLGSTFTMVNMTMNNMLRAEGSAKLSMIGMMAGALLNIALDPLFIFGFGWGIAGAAIATSLSQLVTFIILLSRYLSRHSVAHLGFKTFKPRWSIYREIFKIGIPTFLRQVLLSVSLGIMNNAAVSTGGQDLLAAVGLVFRVYMMPMYVLFGIGQGFQPVVGYNYGARNRQRIVDTLRYTMVLSGIVAVVFCGLLMFLGQPVLSVFKAAPAVMEYGVQGLRLYAVAMLFMALSNTIGVFYQAIGKGGESLLLAVARQGIFFIPALYILPGFFGADGVLGAQLVADVLTMVLAVWMMVRFTRRKTLDMELSR